MLNILKQVLEGITSIFNKKKNLKLGLYGPPNAGKCVTPETNIVLQNGKLMPIKEVFDFVRERKGFFDLPDFEEISIDCKDMEISVPSLDPETLKIKPKKISYVYAQKYKGDIYRIKTRSGREIRATPDHPLINISNNGVEKIKAINLRVGSTVAITKKVALSTSIILENNINVERYNVLNGNMIQIQSQFHQPKPIATPSYINEEFVTFVAYTLAESYHTERRIKFSNKQQFMLNYYDFLSRRLFNLETIHRLTQDVPEIEINSKTLIEYLKDSIDFKPATSAWKEIPAIIMGLPDDLIKVFLRTLFDCEGFVPNEDENRGSEIEFSSKSKKMIEQVQILLNRFGIVGRFREKTVNGELYHQLFIGGSDQFRCFKENIGFLIDYKKERLNKLCERKPKRNKFHLPIMGLLDDIRKKEGLTQKQFFLDQKHISRMKKDNRISYQRLDKMAEKLNMPLLNRLSNADTLWDEITEIKKEEYEGYVYDLTIEGTHTFMLSNGLIAHNTTLANRICQDWLGEEMGTASAIPHETREIQIKEQIKIKSKGKTLSFNLVDTPGIATKIDYEDFLKHKMSKKNAKERAKEATKGVIEAIKWLDKMDCVVVVLDSTINPYSQVNITIIGNLAARDIPVLIAANKNDLKKADVKKIESAFPQYPVVPISAEKGSNIEEFYKAVFKVVK